MDETRALELVRGHHALVVGLSGITFKVVPIEAAILLCALFGALRSPLFGAVVILLGLGLLAFHLH